jgi:N-acetylmuramic acid 6-phosphate etherase
MRAAEADEARARAVLQQCDHHVKVAVVALRKDVSVDEARALLDAAKGSVRQALAS